MYGTQHEWSTDVDMVHMHSQTKSQSWVWTEILNLINKVALTYLRIFFQKNEMTKKVHRLPRPWKSAYIKTGINSMEGWMIYINGIAQKNKMNYYQVAFVFL